MGLFILMDEYQIFYQWFPFEASHRNKTLGKSRLKNLIEWEWQGPTLIPR